MDMRKVSAFLFLAGLLSPVLLSAQEKIDTAMIRRIRQEALLNSRIPFIAHQLTDVCGPRLTNSPGFHHAAAWIVQTLKAWGIDKAQTEAWGEYGLGWSAEKTSLAMRSPYYSPLIAYASPWSGSTNGPVTAPVFLLQKSDSAYIVAHLPDMKGKILLLIGTRDTVLPSDFHADAERYTDSALAAMGDTYMFTKAMANMYRPFFIKMMKVSKMLDGSGALALLEPSGLRDGTVVVQGFTGYRKKDQPMLPALTVAKEDFLRLQRLAEDGLPLTLELQSDTKLYTDDLQGHNVVAEIPGTDPALKSEVVMLGGHLDSWTAGTGATDNGAGSIVALEAMRILRDPRRKKPRRGQSGWPYRTEKKKDSWVPFIMSKTISATRSI